jgi:hypothetical protein
MNLSLQTISAYRDDQDYTRKLSSLYLSQSLNFIQFINIFNKMFIYVSKIDRQLDFPFGFTSGDIFAFIRSECVFPSL